jgi:hypothetical protein
VLKFENSNICETECNSLPCTSIDIIQWQFVVETFVVENLKRMKRHTLSMDHVHNWGKIFGFTKAVGTLIYKKCGHAKWDIREASW